VVGPFPLRVIHVLEGAAYGAFALFAGWIALHFALQTSHNSRATKTDVGIGVVAAAATSLVFVAATAGFFRRALSRRRRTRIRVTPSALELVAPNGAVTTVERVANEQVRVADVPNKRGENAPAARIVYGEGATEVHLVEIVTNNGAAELGPFVDDLRAALREVPRSSTT
jgi:ABC-type nitrate/sulfonate/bicarbonate transport system substrate-binding protein